MRLGLHRFGTALGEAALVFSEAGLRGVVWPRPGGPACEAVARRWPGLDATAPDAATADAAREIVRLLDGRPVDLTRVRLDERGVDAFRRAVYAAARRIRPGRVATYGELAAQLDATAVGPHPAPAEPLARAVGRALGANPWPIVVPCHRVVAAGGRLGGFSAPGGPAVKAKLLAIESARFGGGADLFDPAPADAC